MLEGLKQQSSRPQYISVEFDKIDFDEVEAQLGLLRELGCRKFKAEQQQRIPGSRVKTKMLDGSGVAHVFEGRRLRSVWRGSRR